MNQNLTIQPVKQLHLLFPDIEGELCSRHSTLFGKLRTTFNKLYDNMQPTYYVTVKGQCELVQQQLTELKLSMALENGITIMVSKTYPQSEIYINCNHFSEEVIFSHSGEMQEGLNTMSWELQRLIKAATSNLHQNQLMGGILYIHSNIPENQFYYKKSLYISVFISLLTLNDNLKNFTTDQIIDSLAGLEFAGSKQSITRMFYGYQNRKFNLGLPELCGRGSQSLSPIELDPNTVIEEGNQKSPLTQQQECLIEKSQVMLEMDKNYKFLFCKLDLAKEDVNYELMRRREMEKRKGQLLEELSKGYGIGKLFELFYRMEEVKLEGVEFKSEYEREYNPRSMEELQFIQGDEILSKPNEFLGYLLKEMQLVSEFSNQKVTLEELINQIWEINSKGLKMHSRQVVELVEDMKVALQLKGCMIVNQDFLMMVVQKNRFTQLICEVKHKMNKGQLKSKSLFKIQDQDLVLQRWSSDKVIGQKIFSSVPSRGLGLFDPSDAIWFD